MGYQIRTCKTVNTSGKKTITLLFGHEVHYIQNGYTDCTNSTSNATILWSHSCAHHDWPSNTRSYQITMDNALRNAINSKINSGGLINLQNYTTQIPEIQASDMNGSNSVQVFGYICKNRSVTGSFDAMQFGYWEGDWPKKFPTSVQYSYDIPNVGNVSDTIMVLANGWYTDSTNMRVARYGPSSEVWQRWSIDQLCDPDDNWGMYNGKYSPFPIYMDQLDNFYNTFAYYTINGVYSRNAGTRGCYTDNAADIVLNSGTDFFHALTDNTLRSLCNAGGGSYYPGSPGSIVNNIIMAITNIDFTNNTITVKFAMTHDRSHSMIAFQTGAHRSYVAMRLQYNYPVTSITRPVDTWGISFIPKSDFNPNHANGTGPSAVIWDSSNNAVVLTAGTAVNNSNGFSKVITREQGTLQCSCANVNNTVKVTIGGYTITIPSNVRTFDVRIIALDGNRIGYWRINAPGLGLSHTFTITYPATTDAPLVTFNNELYTAITQALNTPSLPYTFDVMAINEEYTINVSGSVRCDIVHKDGKNYYTLSIYDVNGDFSRLLVKNGMFVTMPITLTADIQVVNNTLLVKAGMSSIGYTSTSIGDISINADAVAVMLPAVASVSKNGSRIGYATTTVNQSSFAFSFSAQMDEVEQTDDFVSHYLKHG